ncbi:hypothetical protein ACJX0J_025990 [Zea mays]
MLYIWTCYLHFQGVCYYCRPDAIAAGYIGHFVIKPLSIAEYVVNSDINLSVGAGIMLFLSPQHYLTFLLARNYLGDDYRTKSLLKHLLFPFLNLFLDTHVLLIFVVCASVDGPIWQGATFH